MNCLIQKDSLGNLTVSSLIIAELFDRPHGKVLRSIDLVNEKLSNRGLAAVGSTNYIDSQGKLQRCFVLTEEQFLLSMPFIGGDKAFDGQLKLVQEFQRLRSIDQNINRHIDAIRSLLLLDAPDKWVKLYPNSYYEAIMAIHGHKFDLSKNKPFYCANVTRRWVYDIVLPDELQAEIDTKRGEERKLQWFNKDNGRQTLLTQIAKVEMIARLSDSRSTFEANCARAFLDEPLQLTVFNI